MSNIFNKIKNIFTGGSSSSGFDYDRKRIRPSRDWKMIFITSIVIVFILAGIASYFYIEIDRGNLFLTKSTKTESEVKINTTILKKLVEDIDNREKLSRETEVGISIPADPSL